MKLDVDIKVSENYGLGNMNRGDTWIIDGGVYIIAWVDGVTLIYPDKGVDPDDTESYFVLISLSDGICWSEPNTMDNIATELKNKNAVKVDAKVVRA